MEGFDLEQHDQMLTEWASWLIVGHEFRARDIDINESEWAPLVRAIECWGEELHALRAMQEPEVVERALEDKHLALDRKITPGFELPA